MRWLGLILLGPTIWALTFSAVYGLHGASCAGLEGPEALSAGARGLMIAFWLAGLAALGTLLRVLPRGASVRDALPRAGAWIGLGATFFTLFPVAMTTSC